MEELLPPGGGGFGGAQPSQSYCEMNSSMVLLPKTPMQARYFDARVGYFTVGYTDFDTKPAGGERYHYCETLETGTKTGGYGEI
jgi:hypothetical protein